MDSQSIKQQLQHCLDELISCTDVASQMTQVSRMRTLLDALETSIGGSPAGFASDRKHRFSTRVPARTFDSNESSSDDPDNENEDSASESENDEETSGDSAAAGSADEESEEKKRPAKKPSPNKKVIAKKSSGPKKAAPKKKATASAIPAPKKPMSAYMIFCQDKRAQFKEENPELSIIDLMKKLAEAWIKMSPEEKEVYSAKAWESKGEYEKAMREYEQKINNLSQSSETPQSTQLPLFSPGKKKIAIKGASDDDEDDETSSDSEEDKKPAARVMKQKRDANAPKRNMSAYMIFAMEMREKVKADMPSATFVDISKQLAERWTQATPDVKSVYEKKAAEDKERYRREMENYSSQK